MAKTIEKPYTENMISFLRGSWARNKVIKNFGGNFWGPNRNRCSILPPNVLQALAKDGIIDLDECRQTFTVNK